MKKYLFFAVMFCISGAMAAGIKGEGTRIKNWSQNSHRNFVRNIGKIVMDEDDQQMVFQTKTAEKGVAYSYSVRYKAKAGDTVVVEIVAKGSGSVILGYYPYTADPVKWLSGVKNTRKEFKMEDGYKKYRFSEVILPDGDGSKVGIINFLIQIDPASDVIIRSFDCSVVPADEEE